MQCPGCQYVAPQKNDKVTTLEIYEYFCHKLKRIIWLGSKSCLIVTPPDCPLLGDNRTEEEKVIDGIWKD